MSRWFLLLNLLLLIFDIELINCSTIFSISDCNYVNCDLRYRGQTFKCLPNEDCTFSCNGKGKLGSRGATSRYSTSSCYAGSYGSSYSWGACECSTITCSNGGYNCNIDCAQQNSCFKNTINCGTNSTCNIDCRDTNACYGGTFNCGDNSICNIDCAERYSCMENIINCGDNSICNIYCKNQTSCASAKFNCGDNSQCNLYCHGKRACSSASFNCGTNSECNIECNAYGQYDGIGGYECYSLTVTARNAKSLSIDAYNNLYSAQYMTVYAPSQNVNAQSQTIIKCGINTYSTSLRQYSCDGIEIHSYQGWNDVQLQINWVTVDDVFQDYTSETQKMYCGINDQYFCFGYAQNGNLMQCHGDIVICNTYTIP